MWRSGTVQETNASHSSKSDKVGEKQTMKFRPIPRSYKTHNYCKKCAEWFKLSVIGQVNNCPECGYKIRKNAHGSKSPEARQKNIERQRIIRIQGSLI